MSQHRSCARRLGVSAVGVVIATSVLTGLAGPSVAAPRHAATQHSMQAPAASRAHVHRTSVGDVSDSYVSFRHPHLRPGLRTHLLAARSHQNRTVVYVKFRVPRQPHGATVRHATIRFTRARHHRPATMLRLYRVRSTHWSQRRLDATNRPRGVQRLAAHHVGRNVRAVSFPIRMTLRPHHTYSFAVTSSTHRTATAFMSRETTFGPSLRLRWLWPWLPKPTPTPTPTSTSTPTPTSTSTPTSGPTAPAPSAAPTSAPTAPAPSASATATASPVPTSTPTATATPKSSPTSTAVPTSTATTPAPTATPTQTPTPTPTRSSGCSLSATLVPSCGVLLGGWLTSYGGGTVDQAMANFNSESGSQVDVVHDYRRPGQTMSAGDVKVAQTPGEILLMNWKPTTNWADADGSNATVNSQIDAMANSIKALGSTKILLTIFHEPENDVSGGAASCPSTIYKGSAGTPADYRAMWANVESRFAALHVTNVVWVMNYMGFSGWNCMVDDLWPGNSLVDWIVWDPYEYDGNGFVQSVGKFYSELSTLSDATHDYLSKPWGLGEFGDRSTSAGNQETFYSTIAQALDGGVFPRLKLLTFFDAVGTSGDYRVAYGPGGNWDSTEVSDLQTLSQDPNIQAGRASVAGG